MGSKKLKYKLCHDLLVALIFLLYILFLEINLCWNLIKHKLLCSLLTITPYKFLLLTIMCKFLWHFHDQHRTFNFLLKAQQSSNPSLFFAMQLFLSGRGYEVKRMGMINRNFLFQPVMTLMKLTDLIYFVKRCISRKETSSSSYIWYTRLQNSEYIWKSKLNL